MSICSCGAVWTKRPVNSSFSTTRCGSARNRRRNSLALSLSSIQDYWSPDAVSRINRKLLAMAGIEEHVRFHDLRHTFATMALSSGVDVKTLSSMLGHFSAGFTLDTYTHITNEMQRGAAEKIGGFMETATAKPEPEPPDPPEESRCKVIPFEKVG